MRWLVLLVLVAGCQRRSEWPVLPPSTRGAPRENDAVAVVALARGFRLELASDSRTFGSETELNEALRSEADRRLSQRPPPQKGDREPELPLALALGAQTPFSQAHHLLMSAELAHFNRLFFTTAGPEGRLDVPVELPGFCSTPPLDEGCAAPVVDVTEAGLWLYAVPHRGVKGCTGNLTVLPPDPMRLGPCPTEPAAFDAARVAATWEGATLPLERCANVDLMLRVAPGVSLAKVISLQQAFWRAGHGRVVMTLLREGTAGPACP